MCNITNARKRIDEVISGKRRWTVITGSAQDVLPLIGSNSIHLAIPDPPYGIDGMGDDWNKESLEKRKAAADISAVGGLPVGMKFDVDQGPKLHGFMLPVSQEVYRVLYPGAFYLAFSQARLAHWMTRSIEEAGFEIRDQLGWTYEGQAKAFTQDHFVRKMLKDGKITQQEHDKIIATLMGRKTPQLKPMCEPIVLGQKPKEGTFVANWMKYETGLIDTTQSLDGKFPGTMMNVPKPKSKEREGNFHLTVKPTELIEHLIRVFTTENQVVLDPFNGSGSHGVAALQANRRYIGIEINKDYAALSRKRLRSVK